MSKILARMQLLGGLLVLTEASKLGADLKGLGYVLDATSFAEATSWINKNIFLETRSFYTYRAGMTLGDLIEECEKMYVGET